MKETEVLRVRDYLEHIEFAIARIRRESRVDACLRWAAGILGLNFATESTQ